MVNGEVKRLLVHRKGATRAFPPHHPLVPVDYQLTGQPVLMGGTMGEGGGRGRVREGRGNREGARGKGWVG